VLGDAVPDPVELGAALAGEQAQEGGGQVFAPVDEGVDDPGVGDQPGQAVLVGGGARGQVAAEALPDQRDAAAVHLGAGAQPVDHRGDDALPVGDEGFVAEEEPAQAASISR